MTVLIKIFLLFAQLSVFSFGGGYAMFPILIREIGKNGLVTMDELTDIIAIAGMSPGAVAVNAAVGVGYRAAGIAGVIVSFLGIAIPCTLIVITAAVLFCKIRDSKYVKHALYGLRPVITGIIFFAAYKIGSNSGIFASPASSVLADGWNVSVSGIHLFEIKSIIIAGVSFILLLRTKVHPVFIIIGSGAAGILLF